MIRISKICLVDGVEINVSAEGGSAKEALSYVENACDELGAAPGGVAATKRSRRTKAEMEAARTAAAIPSELGPPTKMIDANTMEEIKDPEPPLANASLGTTTMFGPVPTAPFPVPSNPPYPARETVMVTPMSAAPMMDSTHVAWTADSPLPQGVRSVELEPPPFDEPKLTPPPDPRLDLQNGIISTLEETRRLAPQWSKAIEENYTRTAAPFGGDIFTMSLESLDVTHKAVVSYRDRVKAHLGAK